MNETRGLWRGKTTPKSADEAFNSVWVEGNLIRSNRRYYIHPTANAVKVQSELGRLIVMHEVVPETLGECTGVRDKNGKLIFEGDIVRTEYGDGFQVCWLASCGMFILEKPSAFEQRDLACFGEFEVIGNIHDNPELLKGDGQ